MMFAPSSGKQAYRVLGPSKAEPPKPGDIPKAKMREVMLKETELRLSEKYQTEYSKQESLDWARAVTITIQKKALEACGFEPAPANLKQLQEARGKYANDPEMNKLTIPQKYDHSAAGQLRVGDALPDAVLLDMAGQRTGLHDYLNKQKADDATALCVLAGSVS